MRQITLVGAEDLGVSGERIEGGTAWETRGKAKLREARIELRRPGERGQGGVNWLDRRQGQAIVHGQGECSRGGQGSEAMMARFKVPYAFMFRHFQTQYRTSLTLESGYLELRLKQGLPMHCRDLVRKIATFRLGHAPFERSRSTVELVSVQMTPGCSGNPDQPFHNVLCRSVLCRTHPFQTVTNHAGDYSTTVQEAGSIRFSSLFLSCLLL